MQFLPVTTLLCQLFPYPDVACARGGEGQPSFRKIFHFVQTLCMSVGFRARVSANQPLGCQDHITLICRMPSPSTAFHAPVCRYCQLSLLSTRSASSTARAQTATPCPRETQQSTTRPSIPSASPMSAQLPADPTSTLTQQPTL